MPSDSTGPPGSSQAPSAIDRDAATRRLVRAVQELSQARTLEAVIDIVRVAARELTGADGAAFVLRDGDRCYYVDENAIGPLWKGQRFPLTECVSGWTMLNHQSAIIPDIYVDPRVPIEAYEPTFVRSLVMVPIRTSAPIGAIGNYWGEKRNPSAEDVERLEALANTTSVAMENVEILRDLENRIAQRTDQLRTANRELESANKELDAFASSVSHDLRAPLRAINGFATILLQDYASRLDSEGQAHLDRISGAARRMDLLIDDLLRFSRLGRQPFRSERFSTEGLVREVLGELAREYEGRRVDVSVSTLPEMVGDRSLIKQVFVNLLSNGFKFTRERALATIAVEAVVGESETTFSVRDNGAGFDMQHASKLFGTFQRLHSQDQFEGTGVGLSLAQRIVARHGGRIWAEAEVDKGATFFFTIPAAS
jgi:signal transduction histidine kinase